VPLGPLTTLGVGGPARRLVEAGTAAELVEAVSAADRGGEPVLVLGGGSNVLVADAGFAGTVVLVRSRGSDLRDRGDAVLVRAQAGEPWDDLVARCVEERLAGIECLSGIPGLTGATPIQNVGAYGQEVGAVLETVGVLDRASRARREMSATECRFGYRDSMFKRNDRFTVLEVTFRLRRSRSAEPVRYAELADVLGVAVGERPPLTAVREAVLDLRRRKGMVIDRSDPDTASAGSFFTNPVLQPPQVAELERRVARRLGSGVGFPRFAAADGAVKVSAAWLIERAGFRRGYGRGAARISAKHTLALTNRGGATAVELLALAAEIRDGVRDAFGVELVPEPVLVGTALAGSNH